MAPPEKTETDSAVWIDARRPACGRHLWGMTLVERQVRELARLGMGRVEVWLSAESAAGGRRLRADLQRLYRVELLFHDETESLSDALQRLDRPLLLLEGDVVYDERVLGFLVEQEPEVAVRGGEDGLGLHLSGAQAQALGRWMETAGGRPLHEGIGELELRLQPAARLGAYIPSLRRTMPPFAIRVPAEGDLRAIDHLMYRRTFKGVIDGVARYGYYHLVRWITRHLSRTELTPNLFTLLSVAGIWAAIPCFAAGHFGWGALAAWIGVIFDSVDGKLARLRLHLSDAMGAFEHIAAMPGLGLWYVATGWHLTGGRLFAANPLALITWGLVAIFLLDKCTTGGFRALVGKELFDYRSIDALFHLVAARRNISLLMLTLGALAGRIETAFYGIAWWTAITWGFHLLRFAWGILTPREDRLRGEGAGS